MWSVHWKPLDSKLRRALYKGFRRTRKSTISSTRISWCIETSRVPEETSVEIPAQEPGSLRCLRCRSLNLARTGKEPYRHECLDCGQHYFVVMQLVPVPTPSKSPLLESPVAEQCPGTR